MPPVAARSAERFSVFAQSHAGCCRQRNKARPPAQPLPIFPLVLVKMGPSAITAALAFQPVPEFLATLVKVIEQRLHLLVALRPQRIGNDLTLITHKLRAG